MNKEYIMNARYMIVAAILTNIGVYAADQSINTLPEKTTVTVDDKVVLIDSQNANETTQVSLGDVYKPMETKIRRSSDGAFVTTANGTEYYSPDQHGGIYGTVYRKYYNLGSAGDNGTVTVSIGVTPTRVLNIGGYVRHSDGRDISIPSGKPSSDRSDMWVYVNGSTFTIDFDNDGNCSSGKVWIDYTK
jgi:hypothetical protein